MERCGTGSWSALSLLRTADVSDDSQSIQFGRPSIALNRDENIVHVVFREVSTPAGTSAELWWSRRSYADCP